METGPIQVQGSWEMSLNEPNADHCDFIIQWFNCALLSHVQMQDVIIFLQTVQLIIAIAKHILIIKVYINSPLSLHARCTMFWHHFLGPGP